MTVLELNLTKIVINMKTVFEFIYNGDTLNCNSTTISIHKTRRGAEMAMEFHKKETQEDHERLHKPKEFKEFPFDEYQSWDVRETVLKD